MTTATQFEYVKLKRVTTAQRDTDWPPGTIPTDITLLIFNTDLETQQFTRGGLWFTLPPYQVTIVDEQFLEFDSGTKAFRAATATQPHALLDATGAHVDTVGNAALKGSIIAGKGVPLDWNALAGGTDGQVLIPSAAETLGLKWTTAKRTLVLTARGIMPNQTEGCTPPVRVQESNGANYSIADFASGEEGSWEGVWPDNWNGGTVTFQYHWIAPTGSSADDTVIFGLKGISYANDDAVNTALGSQVTKSDAVIAVGDVHISAESDAVTLAGSSPTGGESFIFEIERTGGTMSEEARLWQVRIIYDTDTYSDE